MITEKMSQGSIFGATLLISGCCIGAGMLGLPVATAPAGFIPSIFGFILAWLFMLSTGLLLLEVNLWMGEEVGLVSMAKVTLGKFGSLVSWLTFLFLFYSLTVAFIAGGGSMLMAFLEKFTGLFLEDWIGNVIFTLLFGFILYLGAGAIDRFNRVLVLGLIVSYIAFIVSGYQSVDTALLTHSKWVNMPFILPVALISFGFHQIIPSMTTYLHADAKALKVSIICGTLIPLIVYFIWEALALGIVPLEGTNGWFAAFREGTSAAKVLGYVVESPLMTVSIRYLAFFALTSTFLSVGMGFIDFLADGLRLPNNQEACLFLCFLVLFPPLILSISYSRVFLVALNFAGGFGTTLLFGILPPLMVWVIRYHKKAGAPRCLPGGKLALVSIILIALSIMGVELVQELGMAPSSEIIGLSER